MHYRPAARFAFEQAAADCDRRLGQEKVRAEIRRLLLRLVTTTSIEVVDPNLATAFDPEDVVRSEPGPPLTRVQSATTPPADPRDMILIPGGTFTTGSTEEEIDQRVEICRRYVEPALGAGACARWKYEDEVRRSVTVPDLWIDRTEVSRDDYQLFVEATRHRPLPEGPGDRSGYPVTAVSQEDAAAYCRWLGRRLPTADEWEYAARGQEGRRYPWGNTAPDSERGNFCDANCPMKWRNPDHDDGHAGLAPIASYPNGATPEGVLDMGGNVREWTATRDNGRAHVKGGGFLNAIDDLVAADVRLNRIEIRDPAIGFRCAMSASGE
jgi:formylglycine-generating enzyme required for sulfatase activity